MTKFKFKAIMVMEVEAANDKTAKKGAEAAVALAIEQAKMATEENEREHKGLMACYSGDLEGDTKVKLLSSKVTNPLRERD